MKRAVVAFTDGSAVVAGEKKGFGGYGAYIQDRDQSTYLSAGFYPTKIGRMELMALLSVLRRLSSESSSLIDLTVHSDSQYVVKSFTEGRLKNWISAGWYNSSGAVKNQDLWKEVVLILDLGRIQLTMKHVKGHQLEKIKKADRKKFLEENPLVKGNVIADILADYKSHKVYNPDLKS